MSDHASLRYNNGEDLKLLLGDTYIREPMHPYQLQWMEHWMQASSSSSSHSHKHCAVSNVINREDSIKGQGHLPVESMKPSCTFESNMWRLDSGKRDLMSYVLQSAEAPGGEKGRRMVTNNSVLRKNVNSFGAETLNGLSVHKLPPSSVNWENFTAHHFQTSESFSSEWKHFPMFDINRKIDTILAPKKRTGYSTMAVKMYEQQLPLSESTLAPHLIEFVSEELQHQQQSMAQTTDQEMAPYESIKGSVPYNCHRPNMISCKCAKEENDHCGSGLVYKERFANTNLTYLKHELCDCSNHSTFMVSEMKNYNEICLGSFGSSWPRLKDGTNACPGDIPHSFFARECGRERGNVSGSIVVPSDKSIPWSSNSNKMPNCLTNEAGTLRIQSTSNSVDSRNGGPQKFSNATQQLLITKKMGMDLCHKDQMVGDSTVSPNVKGTAFFEMLTLPSILHRHGQREENSQPLVSSTNKKEDCDDSVTHFMEKQNESSIKTDTMYIDIPRTPNSPAGETSSKSQKDVVCPNLKGSELSGTNTNRTESMDIDHILSQVAKPSNLPMESTLDSEPSWKWVKRLRPNPLDSIPLVTKRFKKGDVSSVGEAQNLFTRVVSYNRSISDLPKCQQLDKTSLLPKNGKCSSGDSVKIMPWIRRWCRSSQEVAPPPPVVCETENSNVLPEKFEAKQFPSLAAMALMGKTVSNFRPCEFRRRGSSIVWNT